MAKKPVVRFTIGRKVGEFTLIRRMPRKKKTSANLAKRWKVRCSCGTELIVPEYYMVRQPNPKTDCGCQRQTLRTTHNDVYRIWLMMHERCYNPNHEAHHHYGGRGIGIHEDWNRNNPKFDGDTLEPFTAFLNHIGPRPSKEYSVDRINVDGNYEPGNVKWATAVEQAANKRPT